MVKDEVEGFLVEPGDVDGLVTRCKQFIDSPELARTMGELARKRLEQEISAVGVANRVALHYGELLELRLVS